jgi:hypothetical protein
MRSYQALHDGGGGSGLPITLTLCAREHWTLSWPLSRSERRNEARCPKPNPCVSVLSQLLDLTRVQNTKCIHGYRGR